MTHGRDVLLRGGTVRTLSASRPAASAVLVRDGVIAATGDDAELTAAAPEGAAVVELDGAVVVPGFVDPHDHFTFTAIEPDMVDCRTPPHESLDEVLRGIATAAAADPEGGWLRGWGFHATRVREGRAPTRAELDEVAPGRPFILVDVSFHACFANSAALERAGIGRDTPDPAGGVVERDAHGEPTGMLLERAIELVQQESWEHVLQRDPERATALVERQCQAFLALGLTAVCDAMVLPAGAELLRRARAEGRLPIGVTELHGGATFFSEPDVDRAAALGGDGVKLFLDASYPTPAIDYVRAGGAVEHAGTLHYAPERVAEIAVEAARRGLHVAMHCGGSRAVATALDAYEEVRRQVPGADVPLRVEHAFVDARAHASRFAELGVHLVTQPQIVREYGHLFALWRGDDQPDLVAFPVRSVLEQGGVVAASSDHPCGGGLAPLPIMAAAMDRAMLAGGTLEPEEAVDGETALRMATLDAARACGRDAEEGSLEPGKRANLAVLDADPVGATAQVVRATRVLQTWVDGACVHRAG